MRPTDSHRPDQTRTKINLHTWQEEAVKRLLRSETPLLESQALLAHVLGKKREWIITHDNEELTVEQTTQLNAALERLATGEPLPYITGKRAFFGMDFLVNHDVLIPRPETELLVEEAILWLEKNPTKRTAFDVGTGSGVIAVSLADAIPDLRITALDISSEALDVAHLNCAHYLHEDQITFQQNNLLENINEKADLITANLPYIPTATLAHLPELGFEPRLALDGGADGLKYITPLLMQANDLLRAGGLMLLEIEATIAGDVEKTVRALMQDAKIDILFDYANLPRVAKITR
jgi:release factor glutamine methyltransferase